VVIKSITGIFGNLVIFKGGCYAMNSIGGGSIMIRQRTQLNQLYTSAQARKILGISPSTLTRLVDKGIVEKVTPPGKKQGYYTKKSVHDYLEQQNLFIETYAEQKEEGLTAQRATQADQSGIVELHKEVYGPAGTPPLETRLEWNQRNPDMDIVVRLNSQIVGHLQLMPLNPKALEAMLTGAIRGWEVRADDIETYEPNKRYNIFVMSAAVQQGKKESISRLYAALLLREAQRTLYEMAEQGKLIQRLYATSRSRDGIFLAQRMGFDLLPQYSTAHRKAFVLDMGKSNAKWAREYREWVASLRLPASPRA
jgi:hypothetical protein